MSPQLLNGYQQSNKGTQTTANLTTNNITARFINPSITNAPIQLYKQDSQSSDAQIQYKNTTQTHGNLPKKLPINNLHYLQQQNRDRFRNINNNSNIKKYTSIQQISYDNEKTQADHNQIRKFIKKADRLNEQNYRKLQLQKNNIPVFNTSSNINIYKSSKNILQEIGGEQETIDKRIRQIYLGGNQRINTKKHSKNKVINNKNLYNALNRNTKTKSYKKPSKSITNDKIQTKTIQIQTQRLQAPKVQKKIKINQTLQLIQQDPDYEPAVPKKYINSLTQKRNNRLLSTTLSALNDHEQTKKRQNISINQILAQQGGRYSKAQAQDYLKNLSKTQHNFLKSVKNQKRSISAINMQDPIYQATVYKSTNQSSLIRGQPKNISKVSYFQNKNTSQVNQQKKPISYNTLQPITRLQSKNLWQNLDIEHPNNTLINNIKPLQRISQKKKQQQNIRKKSEKQIVQQFKEKNSKISKVVGTQNSLYVQKNQSVNNYSNSPSELEKNASKISKNKQLFKNGLGQKIVSKELGTGTYQSFWQHKNYENDELSSPILHNAYTNKQINQKQIQYAQKSIQAPQISKLQIGATQSNKHKPAHPITIAFQQKDKNWILQDYFEKKMKHKIQNLNQQSDNGIKTDNFVIKKYRNGVYFGEIDQQNQNKHGYGAIFYYNGKMYEGQFKNNVKEGRGTQNFPDGSTYKGDYVAGLKNGKGTFNWGSGKQVYQGQWANGKRNGSGMWKRLNGNKYDIYIGQWKNGKIQGFGVLTVAEGHRYEGQFKNSEKQGLGTQRYDNGDTYVGEFRKSRPNGNGQYYWASGGYYKGQFSNGLKHGKGLYQGERPQQNDEQNKEKQKSQKKSTDKKNVKSIMKKNPKTNKKTSLLNQIAKQQQNLKQQVQYWGEFRNDKKCGFGEEKIKKSSGQQYIYRGNFQNDMRHGYGQIVQEGKFTNKGYWINGVKVGESMPVIQEDQMDRIQSIPQKVGQTKAKIRKQAPESLSKGKKKLKKSISPKNSPKKQTVDQLESDPNFKRPCGCKKIH